MRFFRILGILLLFAMPLCAQQMITNAQQAATTGTVTTSSSTISVATIGYGVATVTVHGTYAGITINFEFSDDGGTTYYSEQCVRTDTAIQESSEALPSNQTRAWDCGIYAASNFRVRASAYTSGTANVGITMSAAGIEPAPTVSETNLPTTVDTNNGSTSANTPRVTLSNDSTGQVVPAPTTGSGAAVSACNVLSAATNNSTNCKSSSGNFYGYEIYNTTTTVYYLRLYNTSSAPTCSSATGFIRSIPIPPAGASGQAAGAISNQSFPVNYTTGIGFCITGGSGSTDNTSAATGVFGEIRYK